MSEKLYYIIGAMVVATFPFRLLPFLLYRTMKKSEVLAVLGRKLPPVMMLLLVLYALKDSVLLFDRDILFQLLCIGVVAVVHWRWKHVLLSIGAGLGLYLILVNYGNGSFW